MMNLDGLPRVPLAHLPTPLEAMPRLSEALGGPRLWIKRDDQTGLALGGNKVRKLEFLIADALAHEATILVTGGAAQSNHCRQTAAAAARMGLRCVLVLGGEPPEQPNGKPAAGPPARRAGGLGGAGPTRGAASRGGAVAGRGGRAPVPDPLWRLQRDRRAGLRVGDAGACHATRGGRAHGGSHRGGVQFGRDAGGHGGRRTGSGAGDCPSSASRLIRRRAATPTPSRSRGWQTRQPRKLGWTPPLPPTTSR